MQRSVTFRTTEGQREAMISCNQDGEVTGILESSARSEEGNLQSFVYSMISCLLKLEKSMYMYIYICFDRCKKGVEMYATNR